MAETIKIGGELESLATGNKVADVANIKDKTQGDKSQAQINADINTALANRYTITETYSKTELDSMITTPETVYKDYSTYADMLAETTHPNGAIYRVANYDGIEEEVAAKYTEYSYDGEQYKVMAVRDHGIDDEPTAGSDNLVKSGGVQNELALGAVYDVSAKNPTAGLNSDGKWESLSALLSDANINTLIPTSVRKGGMSIKFIQSSDNNYVQYRLMLSTFTDAQFTNPVNWQGVDEDLKPQSKNVIEGAPVMEGFTNISKNLSILDLMQNSEVVTRIDSNGSYCKKDKLTIIDGSGSPYGVLFYQINKGDIVKIKTDIYYLTSATYVNIFFVERIETGQVPEILGYVSDTDVTEDGEKYYYYIAPCSGYIGVSYRYSTHPQKIHYYLYNRDLKALTLSNVTEGGATVGELKLPTGGSLFEQFRLLSKNLSILNQMDFSALSSIDSNGSFCKENKLTVISSGSTYNNGIVYAEVNAGDAVRVKTDVGYMVNSGYADVFFVENFATNAIPSIIGGVLSSVVTETEEKNHFFIAPKHGYVGCSYFFDPSGASKIHLSKAVGYTKINTNEFIRLDENINFPNIGTIYYADGRKQTGVGDTYASSDIIPIKNYRYLKGKLRGNNNIASVLFMDENKDAITGLSIKTTYLQEVLVDLSNAAYSDVKYIVCSIMTTNNDSFASLKTGVAYLSDLNEINSRFDSYILKTVSYNKYRAIGDSLTNASNWINIVKNLLNINEVVRAGASGSTMADRQGNNSIHQAIMSLTADSDLDLISVWGGTNDYSAGIPLGDFDEQYSAPTRDTTTFYGAYIESVEHLISTFPKARIFLIGTTDRISRTYNSSNPWSDARDGGLTDYVDATKKIAEHYSLPFLDLLRTSGITKFNISEYMFLQTWPTENPTLEYYLHFNAGFGTESIGRRIAAFINTI